MIRRILAMEYSKCCMAITLHWLDWNTPCLPAAAAWLIDRQLEIQAGLQTQFCDLQNVICVLPGRRAGRLLLGQLIEQCHARGLRLIPPRILSPGTLMEAWTLGVPI